VFSKKNNPIKGIKAGQPVAGVRPSPGAAVPESPSRLKSPTAGHQAVAVAGDGHTPFIKNPPGEYSGQPVEQLFPFVLKARALFVGRDTLRANRSRLHFVLITEDIAASSREEVLKDFAPYPVVQHYAAADLEKYFNVKGAKAVGFAKSGLAQSIYAGLKQYRINRPLHPSPTPSTPPVPPSGQKA
jgi:hypothetical protein